MQFKAILFSVEVFAKTNNVFPNISEKIFDTSKTFMFVMFHSAIYYVNSLNFAKLRLPCYL